MDFLENSFPIKKISNQKNFWPVLFFCSRRNPLSQRWGLMPPCPLKDNCRRPGGRPAAASIPIIPGTGEFSFWSEGNTSLSLSGGCLSGGGRAQAEPPRASVITGWFIQSNFSIQKIHFHSPYFFSKYSARSKKIRTRKIVTMKSIRYKTTRISNGI